MEGKMIYCILSPSLTLIQIGGKMQRVIIYMSLILMTSIAYAQETESSDTLVNRSKIARFLLSDSRLNEYQDYDLGKIGGTGRVNLYAVKAYIPNGVDTVKGFRFEVTESGQYGNTRVAMIDIDEAHDLIQALIYLAEITKPEYKPNDGFRRVVSFTSKDNFGVGYSPGGGTLSGYCRAGRIGAAYMWMTLENYQKMIVMINQGLEVLGVK